MSPVVAALQTIAGAAGHTVRTNVTGWSEDAQSDLAVFAYSDAFDALWGMEEGGLAEIAANLWMSCKGREYSLVVVWDGTEDIGGSAFDVASHVTPYDWAAALSIALSDQCVTENDSSPPRIRFLIFNLFSGREGRSFIERNLYGLQNLLPWLQDYRPVVERGQGAPEVPDVLSPDDPDEFRLLRQAWPPWLRDADLLINDLMCPFGIRTMFEGGSFQARHIGMLKDLWRQHLVRPGDRHAIANLLGPLILGEALPETYRDTLRSANSTSVRGRQALLNVVRCLGLVSSDDPNGREGARNQGAAPGLRLRLIDDQFDLGFHHILGFCAFGSEYKGKQVSTAGDSWCFNLPKVGSLRCTATLKPVLDTLRKVEPVKDWSLPRALKIPDCDVLVLDLRLWRAGDATARRSFFEEVVKVARELGANAIAEPEFRRCFAAAQALATGADISEIEALALPALLVSHYDEALPIVLFSSTHQREVIERVSHRPNIITTFAKPLLSGYELTQRSGEYLERLAAALRRASRLHEARGVWERLCAATWAWDPPFQMFKSPKGPDTGTIRQTFNTPDGIPQPPNLRGDDLRRILALRFRISLTGENYFDFAAAPYEMIEGALTPDGDDLPMLNSDDQRACSFSVLGPLHSGGSRRNELASALAYLRHRRAHGYVLPPASTSEREAWRKTTILEFLLLLDYIQASDGRFPHGDGRWHVRQKLWKLIQENCPRADGKGQSAGTLPPWSSVLVARCDIPWPVFVVYAVTEAVEKGQREHPGRMDISEATFLALETLIAATEKDSPVRGVWSVTKQIPARTQVATDEKAPLMDDGTETFAVVSVAATGFYVGDVGRPYYFCEAAKGLIPPVGSAARVRPDTSRVTSDGFFFADWVEVSTVTRPKSAASTGLRGKGR